MHECLENKEGRITWGTGERGSRRGGGEIEEQEREGRQKDASLEKMKLPTEAIINTLIASSLVEGE